MRLWQKILLKAVFLLLPVLAHLAPIVGRASVVDGDTLEIGGVRIRLWGVDAPEASQMCQMASGERWPCGRRAAFALADFLGQRTVHCTPKEVDRYGRPVAVCTVGGVEVNRWLVAEGWALAYVAYGGGVYLDAQAQAKAQRKGIWQGTFQPPWEYRVGQGRPQSTPSPSAPGGSVYYRNCAEARAAGAAPLYRGQPGYRPGLDRDGDGIACER